MIDDDNSDSHSNSSHYSDAVEHISSASEEYDDVSMLLILATMNANYIPTIVLCTFSLVSCIALEEAFQCVHVHCIVFMTCLVHFSISKWTV